MECRRSHAILARLLCALTLLLLAPFASAQPALNRDIDAVDLARRQRTPDPVYQVSLMDALLQGMFHGVASIAHLKAHGDFGVGTFQAVDGEMIVNEGRFYRVRVDGTADLVADGERTPFAVVTFFQPEQVVDLTGPFSQRDLEDRLLHLMERTDVPFAIRVTGNFTYMHTRSVPAQSPPYPPLDDVIAQQRELEFTDVHGTMVGFWFPESFAGLQAPGFHFHWIRDDLTTGGHVLSYRTGAVRIELDGKDRVVVDLPASFPLTGVTGHKASGVQSQEPPESLAADG